MGQEAIYRIRVRGQLGPGWSSWFAGLTVHAEPDGTTQLNGELADQAALHGLLAAIRDLGLPLISVETIANRQPQSPTGEKHAANGRRSSSAGTQPGTSAVDQSHEENTDDRSA